MTSKLTISQANVAIVRIDNGDGDSRQARFAGPDSARAYINKTLHLNVRQASKRVEEVIEGDSTVIQATYGYVIREADEYTRLRAVV